jgi:riboflavin kinase/FMN adenylyltransferase
MKVFRSIEEATSFVQQGSAATIGSFDGIHVGHQAILAALTAQARSGDLKSVVVTFDPHAQQVLSPADAPQLLSTTPEKTRLLERHNLDALVILEFTRELSLVGAADFLRQFLLDGLSCRCLVVGLNHAFGHRREGDANFLSAGEGAGGYRLITVEPVAYSGAAVRSSRIRREIRDGDFPAALDMLGHDFEMAGTVVRGKGLGKRLGFPTVNVKLPPEKLIPPEGVYAAYIIVGSVRHFGMMYIGESCHECAFEVNLFDYEGDLYGEPVSVYPTRFIRRSIRFSDNRDLIKQIELDEVKIRALFNTN